MLLPVRRGYAPLRAFRRPAGMVRSLHAIDAVRHREPVVRREERARPRRLHRRDLHQRAAAVRGAAAVHQAGAAAARRLAGGVVGGDGVLPVAIARRLSLRALPDAVENAAHAPVVIHLALLAVAALALPLSIASAGASRRQAATRSGCSACSPPRSACRSSRSPRTTRCCRHGSSAPATPRTRPVLPLCLVQHRQLPRAAVLSGAAGADVHAAQQSAIWTGGSASCSC